MGATKEELKALRRARRFISGSALPIGTARCAYYICTYSNITQKRLGELLGQKSRSYICNIIAGRRVMGAKERLLLADLLKLNKADKLALLEGE